MEKECQIFDIKINAKLQPTNAEIEVIQVYNKISHLEEDIKEHHNTLDLIQEAITMQISKSPEKEDEILEVYKPRTDFFSKKIIEKVLYVII